MPYKKKEASKPKAIIHKKCKIIEASALAQLIRELEESLLKISVRQSPEKLNKLSSDNFFEFASSGKVYNKKILLESLAVAYCFKVKV